NHSMLNQISGVYKDLTLWFLSLFYFITFGAFVAFTVFLPSTLVDDFHLTPVDAGLRTAGFIALATFIRPVGGWLADKFNAFIILMFTFLGVALSGVLLSFSPTIEWYTIGALVVGVSIGIGNGTIFKLVPLYFSKQAGVVNGIVSAMGGLGGFFPQLLLTAVYNITGQYSIAFMLLSELALASFIIVIFMYYSYRMSMERNIIEGVADGVMVTNNRGIIQTVNPDFTRVTGFTKEEAIGRTPKLLSSGKHDKAFYNHMWNSIEKNDHWEGEIWNKRKNGDIYKEWLSINKIKNSKGEVQYYAGMFSEL